ncbi:hypothetical protein [Rhizobium sp. C4]|uniref:hypothetical protein n=1 Tax=Rhizobium sp. C4 TaxID=1349800 RepID=UPI001E53BC58|nr:hypothetical protein [Rhizobium sp. C4]MCD2172814.1 hypothetical protein [Rhizobium sp. C4]
MLIEFFETKWPEIRKIGQDAAERGKGLGLKTDWQEEREAQGMNGRGPLNHIGRPNGQ